MAKALRQNDVQVLTDVEHVLLRPGMYAGSVAEESIPTYIYVEDKIVQRDIPQIPAMLKLFDEIVSNSVDEAIRTQFKYGTKIRVSYNEDTNEVTVEDNGRGLPIELDKQLKIYTPEVIFTKLRAGSNFDDDNKEMLVGQNGVGGSLTAVFSKVFTIETANGQNYYKQTFENHTAVKGRAKIKPCSENYTSITYQLNYDYFKISEFAKTYLKTLYYKRVRDLAFAYPEITFYFNKERLNTSYLKGFLKQIHEVYEFNEVPDARIGLFYSDTDFQQLSFVNGANTSRGGTHIDYCLNTIIEHVRVHLKKKHKIEVKPIDIKSKLFLILSIRMKNPAFDSQTKERLISPNNFKDLINTLLSKKFLDSILRNEEIILPIVEAYKLKLQVKDNLELKKLNQNKKKIRIEKYDPAVKEQKYLLLCEGDSALGGLQAALGRDVYSYFALKGKPLNTLEVEVAKIKTNDEIKAITTILNLDLGAAKQEISHEMIVCAQDADLDGQHIMALLLAFFKRFAPSLIKEGKIGYLRTPLLFAKKKDKIVEYFFTMEEFKVWEAKNPNHGLHFSYVKGLGTWETPDLKALFNEKGIKHFIKAFEYDDTAFDQIDNWMSGKTVEFRKNALRGNEFNIDNV